MVMLVVGLVVGLVIGPSMIAALVAASMSLVFVDIRLTRADIAHLTVIDAMVVAVIVRPTIVVAHAHIFVDRL